MKRLTDEQKQQVADAIAKVEKTTDAELVTVLVKRSDQYAFIPFLCAAVIALLVPLVGALFPEQGWSDWLLWQWLVFIVLALLLRLPGVERFLIPKRLRHYRAATQARCQFLQQNLHATKDGTGLLIFVSEAERYVEILADRGISQHISNDEWQQLVNDFTAKVARGETLQGFLDCINGCGEKLAKHIPVSHEVNEDELPNHLVVLGY